MNKDIYQLHWKAGYLATLDPVPKKSNMARDHTFMKSTQKGVGRL